MQIKDYSSLTYLLLCIGAMGYVIFCFWVFQPKHKDKKNPNSFLLSEKNTNQEIKNEDLR